LETNAYWWTLPPVENAFLSFFACIPQNRGVQAGRELKELREMEHDSTGLRAHQRLITPLLRCVSLEKHTRNLRASDATQQQNKKGSRQAPLFASRRMQPFVSRGIATFCFSQNCNLLFLTELQPFVSHRIATFCFSENCNLPAFVNSESLR